ncbi:MAG: dihydrolipoyl dehydrogenase family protein [Alphaproteobacteria bacterium]
MTERTADICVIGAGSGGLSVAAGAAQMGARVVLIERNMRPGGIMGGDCLHTGCVPSKALLAAAHQAHALGEGAIFGVEPQPAVVDFVRVQEHVAGVIANIAPTDSTARFEDLGVTVIEGQARFVNRREVEVDGERIRANHFVLATGSEPAVPPVKGLEDIDYFTNETIFANEEMPDHLVVLGGGPIGLELAQAHRRLGSRVTVVEMARPLSRDDPELAEAVVNNLRDDGVNILAESRIDSVTRYGERRISVQLRTGGQSQTLEASHLLVAAGRKRVVDGLDLGAAGVRFSEEGIRVDKRLRTSNRRISAIGDCVDGSPQFTHLAAYHAGIVIRNAVLKLPASVDMRAFPWVTYTDPELAHVGLTEEQARDLHKNVRVVRWNYEENDRAQTERRTDGMIKLVAKKNGRILGVSIVGHNAGEVIQPWILAMSRKLKVSAVAGYIAPYPTLGELNKRAAGQFYAPTIFGPLVRAYVRFRQRVI